MQMFVPACLGTLTLIANYMYSYVYDSPVSVVPEGFFHG